MQHYIIVKQKLKILTILTSSWKKILKTTYCFCALHGIYVNFLSIIRGGMDYMDKNSFDLEIDMSP